MTTTLKTTWMTLCQLVSHARTIAGKPGDQDLELTQSYGLH